MSHTTGSSSRPRQRNLRRSQDKVRNHFFSFLGKVCTKQRVIPEECTSPLKKSKFCPSQPPARHPETLLRSAKWLRTTPEPALAGWATPPPPRRYLAEKISGMVFVGLVGWLVGWTLILASRTALRRPLALGLLPGRAERLTLPWTHIHTN
ncbi:uncharacterized protein B0I36DRAFT_427137, partial [Microdochium trichocladiopsis]